MESPWLAFPTDALPVIIKTEVDGVLVIILGQRPCQVVMVPEIVLGVQNKVDKLKIVVEPSAPLIFNIKYIKFQIHEEKLIPKLLRCWCN